MLNNVCNADVGVIHTKHGTLDFVHCHSWPDTYTSTIGDTNWCYIIFVKN